MDNATTPATESAPEPTTFDKGVEEIAALLTDPETPDLPEENEAPAEGDEPEATAESEQEDDGPEEVAASGRFVSRDAKVKLDDGTVITVGDLARNNLFQRDYTRKTEELKAERESFKAERSQYGELAQALATQRDFLLSVAPKLLPAPPDRALLDQNSPKYDPLGFQQQMIEYNDRVGLINQIYHQEQAEKSRRDGETKEEKAARQRDEATKLLAAIPEFKDRKVYEGFMSEVHDVMASEYGFSDADLKAAFEDHRYYKAMRDLVLLSKARKKTPQVKQEVQTKPRLMKPGARVDPKQRTTRDAQQRTERLRKTGDFDAGVAALMDLNL